MSRLASVFFAILLLILLIVLVDPNARQKATALADRWGPALERWNRTVAVNVPSIRVQENDATPVPTVTPAPAATELLDNDDEHLIPTTGGDDSQKEPIIQINWDALKASLQNFWNELRNIKIEFKRTDSR